MEIIKPRLLVVGDSFFYRDPKFPGQHWSEMLPDYEIDNRAEPGHSIHMILLDLAEGLTHSPDAVVIGFTGTNRIEFKNSNSDYKKQWVTSAHKHLLNRDQELLVTLYQSLTDPSWRTSGACWQIIGALNVLKSLNIPFVYSLGIFQTQIQMAKLLTQYSDIVKDYLSRFALHSLDLNLATYPPDLLTTSPLFHVPDPNWQRRFADEVTTKLKTLDI